MRLMDAVHENRLLSRWGRLLPRAAACTEATHAADAELVPLGDGRLLALTVDTVAEEIEIGLYADPRTAGRTAAIAALSDLAAVGADPIGLLLSVTLPAEGPEAVQERVAAGVSAACEAAGVGVLGGDTNEGRRLQIGCTAVGIVDALARLTRLGARAGDHVFATGPLGLGSALAARRVLGLAERLCPEGAYAPPPRLAEGRALRGIASACMDTSDGLVATLDQIARLNEVAIHVEGDATRLLHPIAERVRRATRLPAFPFLAGQHGEFELVFTAPPAAARDLERRLGRRPLHIGRVAQGQGLYFGRRYVDGAQVRNLLHESAGDLAAYLHGLVRLGGPA